jgi:hypothetical protein
MVDMIVVMRITGNLDTNVGIKVNDTMIDVTRLTL